MLLNFPDKTCMVMPDRITDEVKLAYERWLKEWLSGRVVNPPADKLMFCTWGGTLWIQSLTDTIGVCKLVSILTGASFDRIYGLMKDTVAAGMIMEAMKNLLSADGLMRPPDEPLDGEEVYHG